MLAMLRSTLIALCIAALSILLAPALRADQCSELMDEYRAGLRRWDDLIREHTDKLEEVLFRKPEPSREEIREHLCTGSRIRLRESQRALDVAKRFFSQCTGQLPHPVKACDVACHERFVKGHEGYVRQDCGGS
jgi:hypothetical protein